MKFIKSLAFSLVVFSFVFSPLVSFAQVWTPPSATPPNGNPDVPVHVGGTPQSKEGPFLANTGVYSLSRVVAPKICTTKVGGLPPVVEVSQSFIALTGDELAASESLYLDCIESWLDVLPDGNANGDTLIWNETTQTWEVGQGGAGLPPGNLFGDVLMWDTHTSSWIVVPDVDYLFTDHTDGVTDFYSSGTSDWQTTEGLRYLDTPDYAELPYNPPDNEYATDRVLIGYPSGTEDNQGQLHPIGEFKSLTWDKTDISSVNLLQLNAWTELRINAGSEGGQTGLPGQVLSVIGANGKAGWVDVGSLLASEAIIPETCTVGQTIEFDGAGWICGEAGGYNTALSFDDTTDTLSLTDDGGTLTTTLNVGGVPDGTIPGQSVFWDSLEGEWEPSFLFRTYDGGDNAILSQLFYFGGDFFTADSNYAYPPNAIAKLYVSGEINYRTQADQDTTGKFLGAVNPEGRVGWVDALPQGDTLGNILAWSEVEQEWQLSDGVFAFPNDTGMINFGDYYWQENSCGGNNMLYVEQDEQLGVNGVWKFNCSDALTVVSTDEGDAIKLSYLEQVPETEYANAGVRHLCYTSNQHMWGVFPNFFDVSQGQVIDCEAGSQGDEFFPGPIGLFNGETAPQYDPTEDQTVYNWEIPFGTNEVDVTACSGGGGGGGGASGKPSNTDRPGGGGGGGGGEANCADTTIAIPDGAAELKITVGRGGSGGSGGVRTCATGTENGSCNNSQTGEAAGGVSSNGQNGFQTKIEITEEDGTILSTPVVLAGGLGGLGGKMQCSATPQLNWSCLNVGGTGGKGADVPNFTNDNDSDNAEYYVESNGLIGRDNEANSETQYHIFQDLQYWMDMCEDPSCGGGGGSGAGANVDVPTGSPYEVFAPSVHGAGADSVDVGGSSDGYVEADEDNEWNSWEYNPGHAGTWAQGGGGGSGASGISWFDTLGGNGVDYKSRGGKGGRGGPGFVSLEW